MSEHEVPEIAIENESEAGARRDLAPSTPGAQKGAEPASLHSRLPVSLLIATRFQADPINEPMAAGPKPSRRSRFSWAAAIAAAAVLAGGTTWALNERGSQAGLITKQAEETKALAKTIDALNARLNVIETAKSHDELVELRRSVGEIRSNVASSRDLSGALAQLAQRVEKLDRDDSAKVDRLNERVDHESNAQAAELAARIDRLEKRVVASAAPVPAPANPPSPQKQSPLKSGSSVSMETTGSIERPRPVLRGYIVLGARDDVALVEGRYGERAVRRGDFLPGAGRVERITRANGSWIVLTEQGRILAADQPY